MGLRCSLFGHAFEEPVTERDRETRGAEVMISVREVRRCSRCGAEQVIAENTEIRHLGSGDDDSSAGQADTGMAERLEAAEESDTPESPAEEAEAGASDADVEVDETTPDIEADETTPEVQADEPEPEGTEDISKFVDKAEDPADSPSPSAEEDVEILDDGTADSAEESAEDVEGDSSATAQADPPSESAADEPASADDGTEAETESKGAEVLGADEDDGASAESDERADEAATEGADEPAREAADGPSDDDEEAVIDDAIIIDNEAGEEERKSDLGRRELAGTGNMFDASAPEDDTSTSSRESPDAELTDYYESSTESSGTERTPSEPSGAEDEAAEPEHAPWPDEEGRESGSDDPGFQFGPDMQQDESVPDGSDSPKKSPSGITSEGPVDAPGQADDTPPKAVVCPECGYETKGIGTSLRAGDICPDCHNGYLAERR